MGKPTIYTTELAIQICSIIATSNRGMASICKEVGIGYSTHLGWLQTNKEYALMYARAKEDQADYLAEEILSISDDKSGDLLEGEFGKVGNNAAIQRSKLQVDSRKWIASKLKPKKYGDKVEQELTGELKIVANFGSTAIPTSSESGEDT